MAKTKIVAVDKTVDTKPSTKQEKNKVLSSLITRVDKKYGKGTISKLGKNKSISTEDLIPGRTTGSMVIDNGVGIGGLPEGRIVEIYGPEAAGKTFLAMHTIGQAQKKGGLCAVIDVEHAMDFVFAASTSGVDVDNLVFSQPDSAEEALDIADELIQSGIFDIILIDSIAALTPMAELTGDMVDNNAIALQPRLIGKFLRKVKGEVKKHGTTLICINQLRDQVGPYGGEITPGGRALKFFASLRMRVSKKETLKAAGSERSIGWTMGIRFKKSKVAALCMKELETDVLVGKGFWREKECIIEGVKVGIVVKSSSYYNLADDPKLGKSQGVKLGHGVDIAAGVLASDPKLAKLVEKLISEA